MSKRIAIIAEKGEQAGKIAVGLGLASSGPFYTGSYNGSSITLGAASGHLIELAPPDVVLPGANWYNPSSLLPVPFNPPKQLKDARASSRYSKLKSIIDGADEIWLATDPDREGEAIGWEILQMAKYKGPVKRMWLTESLEPADIVKAAKKIKDSSETKCLWRAQQARGEPDWYYMLVTRAFTSLARAGKLGPILKGGKGKASVASVGRVQSAVLGLIVERDREIDSFVPVTHYLPLVTFDVEGTPVSASYKMKLEKGEETPYFTDKSKVQRFLSSIQDIGSGTVADSTTKTRKNAPPLPFSLTQLQREMSRTKKISPSDTMKIADSLRLNGFLTYPRTEHGELPVSMYNEETIGAILKALGRVPNVANKAGEAYKLHFGSRDSDMPSCFSKKKMEHHGIIPTTKIPKLDDLNSKEKAIYDACCKQLVQAMYPPAIYEDRSIVFEVAATGMLDEKPSTFKATSSRLTSPGWKNAFGSASEEDEGKLLPKISKGAMPKVLSTETKEQVTKPPKHFTFDSLLAALLHAGRHTDDDEARAMLNKVSGIGTPATRHTVIDTLIKRAFLSDAKNQIIHTERGGAMYDALPKELTSVEMTAQWESRLKDIEALTDDAEGCRQRDAFIKDQSEFVTKLIQGCADQLPDSEVPVSHLSGAKKLAEIHGIPIPPEVEESAEALEEFLNELRKLPMPPTPKMLALAEKIAEERNLKLGDARVSFDACRKFLDEQLGPSKGKGKSKGKSKAGKPTPKMVSTVESVCERKKIKPPRGYKTKFDVCKAFLDEHLGKKS